jgi:hypothetical protein
MMVGHRLRIKIYCRRISGTQHWSEAVKTHLETLKCHHAAEMIIARYERRLKYAKHALNADAEGCSLDVRVPEMIAELPLTGRLSVCSHTAHTAPEPLNQRYSQ